MPGQTDCSGEASGGGDGCPPEKSEEEKKEKANKKRILDYLHEPQDDDEVDESGRKNCDLYPSPHILPAASSDLPAPPCKAAAADAASLSSSLRSLLIEKPSALRSAWFPWRGRPGKNKSEAKRARPSAQKERRTGKMASLAPEKVGEGTRKVARLPPCCSSTSGTLGDRVVLIRDSQVAITSSLLCGGRKKMRT